MAVYRVFTDHFWLIIQFGGPLNSTFGKIFSGNIINHHQDSQAIILSLNLDLRDHKGLLMMAYRVLMRHFWLIIKNGGLLDLVFGE